LVFSVTLTGSAVAAGGSVREFWPPESTVMVALAEPKDTADLPVNPEPRILMGT
jgi:hypothetical protein